MLIRNNRKKWCWDRTDRVWGYNTPWALPTGRPRLFRGALTADIVRPQHLTGRVALTRVTRPEENHYGR